MKLSSIFLSLVGATVASAGWIKDCGDCTISGAVITCRDCVNGYYNDPIQSTFDLGQCFANDHGALVFRRGGSFAASCGSIQVNSEGVLSAKCNDGSGGSRSSSISIRDHVVSGYVDGLGCAP